jgi:hypothetical protein
MASLRPDLMSFFEIGYFLGFQDGYYWDYEDADIEPVIILKEKSVEMNSDLSGVEYIEYEQGNIQAIFHRLDEALEKIYELFTE